MEAWLWTWRLGILSDFPVVALGIIFLSSRGKVGNDLLWLALAEGSQSLFGLQTRKGSGWCSSGRGHFWLCQGTESKKILPWPQAGYRGSSIWLVGEHGIQAPRFKSWISSSTGREPWAANLKVPVFSFLPHLWCRPATRSPQRTALWGV